MKHFTSGLSAAAKTTLRSSPSSTHFHEISIPRDPVTTFRTSQNVSVIDLINRFRRPRSQIPEILGYQCDAHALCKARHHRLTVYERNLSAFSPIFSRGNVYYSRASQRKESSPLGRVVIEASRLCLAWSARSFAFSRSARRLYRYARGLRNEALFALRIAYDAPSVPRNVSWIYPNSVSSWIFFFSRILRTDRWLLFSCTMRNLKVYKKIRGLKEKDESEWSKWEKCRGMWIDCECLRKIKFSSTNDEFYDLKEWNLNGVWIFLCSWGVKPILDRYCVQRNKGCMFEE